MPDFSTLALSGVISGVVSAAVSWSTVKYRFRIQDRREQERWLREVDSIVSQAKDRLDSISKGRKLNDPATLQSLDEEGQFDQLDEWIQELNAMLSGPPEDIDGEIYSVGKLVVGAYDDFRYGGYDDSGFKDFDRFQRNLSELYEKLRDARGPKAGGEVM